MAHRLLLIGVVALVLAPTSGCGQGFSGQSAAASFAEANDASAEEAECVVGELIEGYGLDQLELELAEPTDAAFEQAQVRAMFRCGMLGDVEEQVTGQLTEAGVDAADAPCVAGELTASLDDGDVDVLLTGQITDAFSAKFYQAMEACDALNP